MIDLDRLIRRAADPVVHLEQEAFDALVGELQTMRKQISEYEHLRCSLVLRFNLGTALRPAQVAEQVIAAHDKVAERRNGSNRPSGEDKTPARPVGPSAQPPKAKRAGPNTPTLAHIQALSSIGDAKTLFHKAPPEFKEMVEEAIEYLHHGATRQEFSRTADLERWRNVLTLAVETSGGADGPPPPVAASSDQASTGPVQAGARGSASAHPGPVDSPTTERGHDERP